MSCWVYVLIGLGVGLILGFLWGHAVAVSQSAEIQSVIDSHWKGYTAELEAKVSDAQRTARPLP